jgi:hypothetical protein
VKLKLLLVCLLVVLPFALGMAPMVTDDVTTNAQVTPPPDSLLAFVVVLYGFAVSWLEERFGSFQNLSPANRQLVNGLLGFFAPLVASAVVAMLGKWPVEIGTPEGLAQAILYVLAPVAVWLVTQVAHYADLWLKRKAKGADEYRNWLPEKKD